jgi:hypothetical protein
MSTMDLYQAAEKLVDWLERRLLAAGRGDELMELDVEPAGKFWLGRLASEAAVVALGWGERGERIDPCAVGIRLKPAGAGPWSFQVRAGACAWVQTNGATWTKTPAISATMTIDVDPAIGTTAFGADALERALADVVGISGLGAEIRVEVAHTADRKPELTVLLVNSSPQEHASLKDTNLYECSLAISGLAVEPYELEALPDSFRYDRRVIAYGINCEVDVCEDDTLVTVDTITADRKRPLYWSQGDAPPDLCFASLAADPIPAASRLLALLGDWGQQNWSQTRLDQRARSECWSPDMREGAAQAAADFAEERHRIARGVELLRRDATLNRAFRAMNRAMLLSANGKYDGWRPFQFGFLLANLASVVEPEGESAIADIVWFATGGGKTETYLGLIVTAALYDRLTGKRGGITAWSRFPLRMLSLQQTQRFANAMAGAERVRREESISGDPFSVGFLVGQAATPNRIKEDASHGEPDPDDDDMPKAYQVLLRCPFCHGETIEMAFDRRYWRLAHRCTNEACSWPEENLPFYIVDEEIYRFLPTVVVGTLDKAASIAMQAAMRGLVGAPWGKCSVPGHGYTYAPRGKHPNGCLVPGCRGSAGPLDMEPARFGPSFRLQDELHLLKDSLGAVDAHYEALYDALQLELCGRRPKILASSATLTGYEKQVDVLYRREARVFPVQGPTAARGFWTSDSDRLMRRFVAVAPRGVTIEYTVDRILTELQTSIRRLVETPAEVCRAAGIEPRFAAELVSLYGTNVVYGNTIRDIDAVMRSLETQVRVGTALNTTTLTGRDPFEHVRGALKRLERPEDAFEERLHVVAASSMMSHGVDIDRLNLMVMWGMPLTTAEFIQTTARVGRRWPGLVLVMHKIARERDAGIYRSFGKYVEHGDRFVEPIPVTRRSRRVLERTVAGLALARILAIHEPANGAPLTTVSRLRAFVEASGLDPAAEAAVIAEALSLAGPMDEPLRCDLNEWFELFFRNLRDPGGTYRFPSDLSPTGSPMLSLRDVEEQAPVYGDRLR